MSDTDDTDVLLLIPPGFFVVHSSESEESLLGSSRTVLHKPVSCTAIVLDKLVDQVKTLENRLENLEISTVIESSSTVSHSQRSTEVGNCDFILQGQCSTFPRRRQRKSRWYRNLSYTSLDSSNTNRKKTPHLKPTKNIEKINQVKKYDSASMDGDLSSIVSTPSKKNDKLLLNEIDEFLTKVESYESPETRSKTEEKISPENVIKATGEYICDRLNSISNDTRRLPSDEIMPNNILEKYIYLVKNDSGQNTQCNNPVENDNEPNMSFQNETNFKMTDNNRIRNLKSPSVRKLKYPENEEVQPTSTPKRPGSDSSYLNTFKPSSNKIYERATKVLEQYKLQKSNSIKNSDVEFKVPQMRPYHRDLKETNLAAFQNKFIDSVDSELISLSDLWGDKAEKLENDSSGKLEEERLKREHCEAVIEQLQKKILEQQEKLAVAMKVDRAKDAAITKLREAWLKLTNNLDKAEERHRAALEKIIGELENFKSLADEAQKKTNHFESELYKALDLAHDYQDKCKLLTVEKKELQEMLENNQTTHTSIVKSKQKEIEMLKENCDMIICLNKQSTDCIKNLEDTLEKERENHNSTKNKFDELSRRLQLINDETESVRQERDMLREKVNEERTRYNTIERQLCEKQNQSSELLRKCDSLEDDVKNLHRHLELQKNELKAHYQKQLEDAVISKLHEFQEQLDHAEKEMQNDARAKENATVDAFTKQIGRIEEQHKLEINILEEKQKEEIKLYRLQLAQASEKISLLENKLESFRRRRGHIASQLHSVMEAQWRQALRILTNPQLPSGSLDVTRDSVLTPMAQDYAPSKIPPLAMPTYAARGLTRVDDRPLADDALSLEGLSDNELQQYVRLLLTKPPSRSDAGHSGASEHKIDLEEEVPTSDKPEEKQERKDKVKRCLNNSKPPWKS